MKIIGPSGVPAVCKVLYLHVALDLSVRRCRTRREVRPDLSNWAGATPRIFWAAEGRKSGVDPARFEPFFHGHFYFLRLCIVAASKDFRTLMYEEF